MMVLAKKKRKDISNDTPYEKEEEYLTKKATKAIYVKTPEQKAREAAKRNTPEQKARIALYEKSDKAKARTARYNQSSLGKETRAKNRERRKMNALILKEPQTFDTFNYM
jgi:hypothetical protein